MKTPFSELPPILASAAKTLWRFHNQSSQLPEKADCIVGLCSYDLRVADRCAALLKAGRAPKILFTGAVGNWTADLYAESEARAFFDHAVRAGVAADRILVEERARNIGENLRFSAAMLGPAPTVILVTKPQTQMRCIASAAMQWPQARAYVSAPGHGMEAQAEATGGMPRLIDEMVGDLARMGPYAAAGFQRPVTVPPAVRRAYEALVAAGFTGHMPAADRVAALDAPTA